MFKKQIKPKSNTFVRLNVIKEQPKSTEFSKSMLRTINLAYKLRGIIY